jgi:hypothetical protein
MGTTIRLYFEKLNSNGNWELAEEPVASPYYTPEDPKFEPEIIPNLPYIPRVTHLFTVLCGLYNGDGSWSDPRLNTISEAQGFPIDACTIGKNYYSALAQHDHLFFASSLLISEIENFNWNQTITLETTVPPHYASYFDTVPIGWPKECPEKHWLFFVSVLDHEVEAGFVKVNWRESYSHLCAISQFKEFLKVDSKFPKISKDSLRIVFWFDS